MSQHVDLSDMVGDHNEFRSYHTLKWTSTTTVEYLQQGFDSLARGGKDERVVAWKQRGSGAVQYLDPHGWSKAFLLIVNLLYTVVNADHARSESPREEVFLTSQPAQGPQCGLRLDSGAEDTWNERVKLLDWDGKYLSTLSWRVYGEMGELLCRDGKIKTASRWNESGKEQRI